MLGNTGSFILNLPNKPVRRQDLANSQSLVAILGIAMTYGINQGFLQTELHSVRGHCTVHRLNELFHQRRQLQGGWMIEVSPAKRETGRVSPGVIQQAFGMTTFVQPLVHHFF